MTHEKRSKPTKSDSTKSDYSKPKLRWISTYVGEEDRKWLDHNVDSLPDFVLGLFEVLDEAYTLSSKYDSQADRWLTTLICSEPNNTNGNAALTARGRTRERSLYMLAYFHMVKYEQEWPSDTGSQDDW